MRDTNQRDGVFTLRLARARIAAALVALLISACSSAPPTVPASTSPAGPSASAPAGGPSPSPALSGESGTPAATDAETSPDPDAVDPNVPPPPLPPPLLATPDEVTEALLDPQSAPPDQVVMSMLKQLGIGVYKIDGSPVEPGTETADTDFILSEPEARGLVEMLIAGDPTASDTQEPWLSFRDFHTAVAGLGYAGTADDLAQAYSDAYAQNPDAPISKFIAAQAFIHVESSMPPLAIWLMFLDGFVAPHGTPALAAVGRFRLTAAGAGSGWGLAGQILGANRTTLTSAQTTEVAQIMALFRSAASISITPSDAETHEGHGGTGKQIDFSATLSVLGGGISPTTGQPLLQAPAGLAGTPITWTPDRSMTDHGGFTAISSTLDANATATANFIPKEEAAKGRGVKLRELGLLTATVSAAAFVHQVDPSLPPLGNLIPATVAGVIKIDIGWHVLEAMHIELRHDYVITTTLSAVGGRTGLDSDGYETFVGDLAKNEQGLWFGVVTGVAFGTASQEGDPAHLKCNAEWDTHQQVAVGGHGITASGNVNFAFQFFPVSNPEGTFTTGVKCLPPMPRYGGVQYLPYNDRLITHPKEPPFGLLIHLPEKPGGTNDYPANTDFVTSNWHVFIQFLEPDDP